MNEPTTLPAPLPPPRPSLLGSESELSFSSHPPILREVPSSMTQNSPRLCLPPFALDSLPRASFLVLYSVASLLNSPTSGDNPEELSGIRFSFAQLVASWISWLDVM